MDRDEVEIHKLAKKLERGQYPAILTAQTWLIKDLLYGFRGIFFVRDTAGSPQRARLLHFALSGSQSHRAIWFILPARGASHKIIFTNTKVFKIGLINKCSFYKPESQTLSHLLFDWIKTKSFWRDFESYF